VAATVIHYAKLVFFFQPQLATTAFVAVVDWISVPRVPAESTARTLLVSLCPPLSLSLSLSLSCARAVLSTAKNSMLQTIFTVHRSAQCGTFLAKLNCEYARQERAGDDSQTPFRHYSTQFDRLVCSSIGPNRDTDASASVGASVPHRTSAISIISPVYP